MAFEALIAHKMQNIKWLKPIAGNKKTPITTTDKNNATIYVIIAVIVQFKASLE